MLNPTVTRRWTVATWLLTGTHDVDRATAALSALEADVIAVQSVRRAFASQLAERLGVQHEWALSHYPHTPLFRSQAVGLATLTPHRIVEHREQVLSKATSTWSNDRRIAQAVLVERADRSAYAVLHSVPPVDTTIGLGGSAPTIVIRPVQVGIDDTRAVQLPADAAVVSAQTTTPIAGGQPMLVVGFEQSWVQADFPSA